MTAPPLVPPKLAPKGTHDTVALYLDHVAERLRPFAASEGLELKPYDIRRPENVSWGHQLYGQAHDRHYGIQIITNPSGAGTFRGRIIGVVMHDINAEEVWLELAYRETRGIDDMVAAVRDVLAKLRLACLLGMPRVTEPHVQA